MDFTNNNIMNAAKALTSNRAAIKALEDKTKELRQSLAISIAQAAIEQPSRVLRLDTYWRATGLQATDLLSTVEDYLRTTEYPDHAALYFTRHTVVRRFAEMDEFGNQTGNFIERREEVPLLVNLGQVYPPVNGPHETEPLMGWQSLLEQTELCLKSQCYKMRRGIDCDPSPADKYKCYENKRIIDNLAYKVVKAALG